MPGVSFSLKSDTLKLQKPKDDSIILYLILHYSYKLNNNTKTLINYFRLEHPQIGEVNDYFPDSSEYIILNKYARDIIKL